MTLVFVLLERSFYDMDDGHSSFDDENESDQKPQEMWADVTWKEASPSRKLEDDQTVAFANSESSRLVTDDVVSCIREFFIREKYDG